MTGLWTPPRPAFHPAVLAGGLGPLWFTEVSLATADWRDLRRIRIATCPWLNCKHYTSVFSVNIDGSIGEPIVGWPGSVPDGPETGDYWWDDQPWCWMVTSFLTASPGSNQTYTSDAAWNNANNYIEMIGGGAAGGRARQNTFVATYAATGGSAGAYQKHTNFTFATPGTTTATYQVGAGGAGGTTADGVTSAVAGNNGGDTWFDGATYGASTVGAKGGVGGNASIAGTSASAVSGGQASSGRGNSTAYNGGGTGSVTSGGIAGAGGAAGPGGAGGTSTNAVTTATDGGQGGNGAGGVGGSSSDGSAGTEWDATHGSGGGGTGNTGLGPANVTAYSGGLYGAGSGGVVVIKSSGTPTASTVAGLQGLIVLTSIPPAFPFPGRPVRLAYLRR